MQKICKNENYEFLGLDITIFYLYFQNLRKMINHRPLKTLNRKCHEYLSLCSVILNLF